MPWGLEAQGSERRDREEGMFNTSPGSSGFGVLGFGIRGSGFGEDFGLSIRALCSRWGSVCEESFSSRARLSGVYCSVLGDVL